jgi:hypothetical protein
MPAARQPAICSASMDQLSTKPAKPLVRAAVIEESTS